MRILFSYDCVVSVCYIVTIVFCLQMAAIVTEQWIQIRQLEQALHNAEVRFYGFRC